MKPVEVDTGRCKGCGLCIEFCPRHLLAFEEGLNAIGFHPVHLTSGEKCTACALCASMCPEGGISVYRKQRGGT